MNQGSYRRMDWMRDASGYSLVETVVALSLVVTVLVPLSSLAIYLFTVKQGEPQVAAQALAQRYMEDAISTASYTSDTFWLESRHWQVRKTVQERGALVTITIRVFRHQRPQPLAELSTVRLRP